MARMMILDEADNVAVAIETASSGDTAETNTGETFRLRDDIPFAHKAARRDIAAGETIIKYGQVIGRSRGDIAAGSHVHVHNIRSVRNAVN